MRPNTTNWGYDVVIAGMATVNPVLHRDGGRPDELVDFRRGPSTISPASRRS